MDLMIREWTTFLDRCLAHRIQRDQFDAAAAQLHVKSPLPSSKLAALLLRPRSANALSYDTLIIVYVERLLALKKVDASDVLSSAFRYCRDWLPKTGENNSTKDSQWHNPPDLDEIIFHRLAKGFQTEDRPLNNTEGFGTLIVVTRWMQAMVTSHTSDTMMQAIAGVQHGIEQQPQQQSINVREGLGMLAVGLVENSRMLQILNNPKCKDLRNAFAQSLTSFITFLSHSSNGSPNSLQIANRLEMSQKQHDFYDKPIAVNREANRDTGLDVATIQLEAVMELPTMNTRAGLYILFNALLVARPLTDDFTIINYLHSRYKIDAQNMATDLVTAAFDILANALYRSEPSQTMFCLKSFLVNKVPILLSQISTSVYPMTLEICITQALSHLDPNAFPAFSQGFDDMLGNNNSLADVRQDFLNACTLHSLIPTATVERLLGEAPMQGPPETKYDKKILLEQCKNNFDKVNMYIDELENLDGNAGAIVGAVTEFIAHLCETQMTMHLKQLSSMVFKKPQVMDVMLQFTSPASILQPLCQCLDDWHYDSDQEYQPVYDEFGAVLVLVMAFVYRYDLTYHDIGIGADTFMARLLTKGHRSMLPDELTDEQGKHLGNWLKGLFDSGNEGLSNDVFASCRPQDFYLIVPTLFQQTVMALSAGILSFDSVKGGLEYLGETFLLPSLIGGLRWMASYALLQTHSDLDAMMRVFHEIMLSAHSSGDAQAMHSAILAMVSSRLEKCFRTLQRRDPGRANNIEPFLQAIKGNLHYERSMYASMKELEQWTNAPNSTLDTSLRHTVQQLAQWASTASMQPNPPSYTHRQVYTSLKILGAHRTLRALIDEIKTQTEAGNGAAALDIGVSIICAPGIEDSPIPVDWVGSSIPAPHPPRTRMNLREMLKDDFDNAASLVATDPLTAETIVRLHRRVEVHFASNGDTTLQGAGSVINIPSVNIAGMPSQTIPDDINKAIDDAAAASIAEDITNMDNKALQRSMEELTGAEGLDLSSIGIGTGDGETGDMGTELGNLPDLDLSDMGGMGMDMDMDMTMGGGGDDDWGLDFENM